MKKTKSFLRYDEGILTLDFQWNGCSRPPASHVAPFIYHRTLGLYVFEKMAKILESKRSRLEHGCRDIDRSGSSYRSGKGGEEPAM